MKALFLGNVAADTANGIKAELPPSLRVEILAEPQALLRNPEVSADADILVTNHWRAEYPPATARAVGAVGGHRHRIDRPRSGAARVRDLQCLWVMKQRSQKRADGHARLEPSLPRDRGRFSAPLVVAVELGGRAGRRIARSLAARSGSSGSAGSGRRWRAAPRHSAAV